MIVSVDCNVLSAEVAAVTEITRLTNAEADCNGMLFRRDNSAYRFGIEFDRPAAVKNSNVTNFAG